MNKRSWHLDAHSQGRALSRRTFLRGTGVAMALPFLDAMQPAFAPPAKPISRHVFVFLPNGIHMPDWTPKSKGALKSLPHILEPLDAVKRDLTVISRLALEGGFAQGDGPGDHARAAASYLTAAHPKKTGGADIRNGVSVDQLLADAAAQSSLYRSLELGLERGRAAGNCDSGYSCAYSNNIAWRSPTTPVVKETDPREVFRRLYGDPAQARDRAAEVERRRRRLSLLDFVLDDMKSLRGKVGRRDREKLDEYFTGLREVEVRLEKLGRQGKVAVPPTELLESAGNYGERLDLMYTLMALALEADLTRVMTFMTGNAGSNRSYRELGIAEGHHDISHHGKDKANYARLRKINRFHLEAFGRFAARLAAVENDEGRLLDGATLMIGSGISDGNRHFHADLPVALVGRGKGLMRGGRHVVAKKRTPAASLYLAMLQKAGIRAKSFGDADKPLSGL